MKTSTVSLLVLLVLAATLTGCLDGSDEGQAGTFELMVSDQPNAIEDFEHLNVTFSEARVFAEGADNETDNESDNETDNQSDNESDEGFETIDIEGETVDLTTVVGDRATSIANVSLEEGNYSKVELHVDSTEGTVDGEQADVKVPSNKLMITKNFTIEANETTSFVFDIQVVEKGNGGYNLLPVVSESGV
ncbi:MAG: DUF4382 domain-containing protein, partial [Halobacteriales archaeon]